MNWQILNNRLTKQFTFKNQTELANFLLQVAKHADKVQHHPDVFVFNCSKMKIELFTHDKSEITVLDYTLATFIDSIEMEDYTEK